MGVAARLGNRDIRPLQQGLWPPYQNFPAEYCAQEAEAMPTLKLALILITLGAIMSTAHGNIEGIFSAKDFGAKADGKTDDTAAIQRAIDEAAKKGGQVYLPPGRYLVKGSLKVPSGVAVKGVHEARLSITPLTGTIILATGGRDDEKAPALFEINGAGTVKGLTVYYPEQSPRDIHPYPWTFHLQGFDGTVEDVTLVNSYNAIAVGPEPNVRHFIKNVYGTALRRGLFIDACTDIGRVENVHFHCHYWSDPATGGEWQPVYDYMGKYLEAFIIGRTDWEFMTNTFVFPAAVGYRFIKTASGACNGNFLGIAADATQNCVIVEEIQYMGLLITNGEFVSFLGDDPTEIIIKPTCSGNVRFVNCAFWGPVERNAVLSGKGPVSFSDCFFSDWDRNKQGKAGLLVESGRVQVRGCTFTKDAPAVELGPGVAHAIIVDNNGPHGIRVKNNIADRAIIERNEPPPSP